MNNPQGPLASAVARPSIGLLASVAAAAAAATLTTAWLPAQSPELLRDIRVTPNLTGGSSDPEPLCADGGYAWFRATDPLHGAELWRTDGTSFDLVSDLVAGAGSSAPGEAVPHPTVTGSVLFTARDEALGRELFVSDGTAAGTRRLADLLPGFRGSNPRNLLAVGNQVFFIATDLQVGDGLWRTDGTAAGTRRIIDLAPGDGGGDDAELAPYGQDLVFARDDGIHGVEPWLSDGTTAGTRMLLDVDPGGPSFPRQFVDAAGELYFVAGVFSTPQPPGRELWRSDGTATGTRLVVDLWPGFDSPSIAELTALGSEVYFRAIIDPRADELWRSDGTAAGTVMVRDIHPTPGFGSGLRDLTAYAGRLWFIAHDPSVGTELFTSDGTAAGTRPVADLSPASSLPQALVGAHGRVWFTAQHIGDPNQPATGFELWVTDGTSAGTSLVSDIWPGQGSSMPTLVLPVHGNTVVFGAADRRFGREPFRSDGTPQGTALLRDASPPIPGATLGSDISAFTTVGDRAFFVASDDTHGSELWVTDGTRAGTRLVLDIQPGAASSDPDALTAAGGRLWFSADDGAHGREMWVSDGTASGTTMVADLDVGLSSSRPEQMTLVGDRLFFRASLRVEGLELCVVPVDLSAAPRLVADIRPGRDNGGPSMITAFGDRVVFRARTLNEGFEPWISDGTASGTRILRDIQPGTASSLPSDFRVFGGRVYFVALDSAPNGSGQEIWVSDGTTAGTQLFIDLQPGGQYSYPEQLVPFGDRMLFTASRPRWVGGEGREPWITDGTPAGTVLLADIARGSGDSNPEEITPIAGGRALFRAGEELFGSELWVTDGTAAGTFLIADLEPGRVGSAPGGFLAVDGGALFHATTSSHGTELWFTDGTTAGTRRLTDLAPGTASAHPRDLSLVAGRVLLSLDEPVHGREPWVLAAPGASVQQVTVPCGPRGRASWTENTPRLGTSVAWRCETPAAGDLRVLFVGLPGAGSGFASGCQIAFDPLRGIAVDASAGAAGARYELALPTNPSLRGLGIVLQGFLTDSSGRLSATSAMRLTLSD